MKREIKFRVWHKSTKEMLKVWPYNWNIGKYESNGEEHKFFDNKFELSGDTKECNRVIGKSVFMSMDGIICGIVPINDLTTRSIDYSEEYELMQFTGLHDKNGKEIYEGDILKLQYPVNYGFAGKYNHEIIVTILFDNGSFWFKGDGYTDCNWHFYNEYEVIGNIYENPELLKT
jgi:uncharacterized phage protein (TIGR01671 family)